MLNLLQTIDENGEAQNMIYVTGSLTTYTNANPTVTMFYLDPVTFEVLDYEHYYNNIDEQNPGMAFIMIKMHVNSFQNIYAFQN